MDKRCTRINKAGVLVEPPNRNSAEMFFKTANDWPRLSGYVGSFPCLNSIHQIPISVKTLKSHLDDLDLRSRVEESKVKPALSYLCLRDLGCSKEQAISFSKQKNSGNADITSILPPKLRKIFKLKFTKKKCNSPEPSEINETFENMSNGFKDFIYKKKQYFESNCAEQEKFLQNIEKEAKNIKNFKSPFKEKEEQIAEFPETNEKNHPNTENTEKKSLESEQFIPGLTFQTGLKDLENIAEEKITTEEDAIYSRSNDYFYSKKLPKLTHFSPIGKSNFISLNPNQSIFLSSLNNIRDLEKKLTLPSMLKEEQKILESIRNIAKRKKNRRKEKLSKNTKKKIAK